MSKKTDAEIKAEIDAMVDYVNRQTSTITKKVVVEGKPVIKEVIKEVEKDCPPCPEEKIVYVDTLHLGKEAKPNIKQSAVMMPDNAVASVGGIIKDGWIYGESCEVETPQEVVKGHFAITSLTNIHPSHIPPSFAPNPKNPYNERDYQKNKSEQGKVVKNANNFNPKFLINDDNTAENGAIIVDRNGVVLGGNGRAMALFMVVQQFPDKYKKYYELLAKKSNYFGISIEKVKNIIPVPVLVRVVETDTKKTNAYYSRIFNESLKLKIDALDMAVSIIKSLGEERAKDIAGRIAALLTDKSLSLWQVMSSKRAVPEFLAILKKERVINDSNRDTFLDEDGALKDEAYTIIGYLFYALVFDNRKIINYIMENDFIKIENVFGLLLDIKTLQKPFNILPEFSSAVEKMKAGKTSAQQNMDANDIYRQENMFAEWRVRRIEYLCMKLFEMKDDKKQKEILQNYLRMSRAVSGGFFAKADATPEELLDTAFNDANVKNVLSKIGTDLSDNSTKNSFPCTLTFTAEEVIIGREVGVIFYCRAKDEVGHFGAKGYLGKSPKLDGLMPYFEMALYDFLIRNKYIKARKTLFGWADAIRTINGEYKTDFDFTLEQRGNKYFLKNKQCDSSKLQLSKKHYMPSMFDKKQSLGSRIIAWFKKDLQKKYRWEEK